MGKAVIHDLDALRAWVDRHGARPEAWAPESVSSGLEALDRVLPGGGFPRGELTVLRGDWGAGRASLAAALVAKETSEGRAAAWIDGRGTLYPPALAGQGVRLERLLIVRPSGGEGTLATLAARAAEQVIDAGVFGVVVTSGVDAALDAARARRLQRSAEGTRACALFVLEPTSRLSSAKLVLGLQKKGGRIRVEVEKNLGGPPGAHTVLPHL